MAADHAHQDRADVLGRRIGAALLDLVVLFVAFVVLALLIGDSEAGDGGASLRLEGGGFLVWLALTLLYYGVSEAATGRTPGKRLLGLRVVATDGSAPGAGAVAIRTVLRVVDALPFLYLVGLVAVLATGRRRQRLGDLAARTTVVAG
jgi:uncharacterized RDD family membrane protein YckC